MIFELKEKKNKFLEDAYEKAMSELDNFFGIKWKYNRPKLFLLSSRKEIYILQNEKTPGWLVGWADGRDVFMLKGNKYKTESTHSYSKERYIQTLKHELCHRYFDVIAGSHSFNQYVWFQEGVSYLAAKQTNFSNVGNKFAIFLDQYSNWDGKAYHESGAAIVLLSKKYGRKKLIDLIKSLPRVKSQKDFNAEFKKIYGENPTYTFFNKLLKEETPQAHKPTSSRAASSK
jgi:hypothetical protein